MPLVRSAGAWGSQTIEPRVQFVTGPQQGPQQRIPNEDSIDFEFTDANLFALNRFTGRDRQEGGSRVDYALRAAWDFPNGGQVEGLVGGSRRFSDNGFNPYPGSGLEGRQSDYVTRLRVAPVSWFETIGRVRVDDQNLLERRLGGHGRQPLARAGDALRRLSLVAAAALPPAEPHAGRGGRRLHRAHRRELAHRA